MIPCQPASYGFRLRPFASSEQPEKLARVRLSN
jgi:hypothetical protein